MPSAANAGDGLGADAGRAVVISRPSLEKGDIVLVVLTSMALLSRQPER